MCDLSVVSALAVSPEFAVPQMLALSLPVVAATLWPRKSQKVPTPMHDTRFVLDGVTVINPGAGRQQHRSVTIRDGRIAQIGERPVGAADGRLVDEFAGAYALPGLLDMHTHLPSANFMKLTPYFCLMFLAHGITSIRDAGDVDGTATPAAREGLARGDFPGPRLFACGPFIAGAAAQRWPNIIHLKQPGQADSVVAKLKANGYNYVKSYDDLVFMQIRELEAAAKRHGLPMMGHIPTALSYEEARIPDVQHFLGIPEPKSLARDHVLNRMADWQDVDDARLKFIVKFSVDHQIVNTPTMASMARLLDYEDYEAAYRDPIAQLLPRIYRDVIWHPTDGLPAFRGISKEFIRQMRDAQAKKKELLARLHEAGAQLLLGTDTQMPFSVPGPSLHEEMQQFSDAGIGLEAIWEMATRASGKALGIPKLGTLVDDAPADLVLYREDPTANLGALKTMLAVIADGKLYRRSDLDAALDAHRKRFSGPIFERGTVAATRMMVQRSASAVRDY